MVSANGREIQVEKRKRSSGAWLSLLHFDRVHQLYGCCVVGKLITSFDNPMLEKGSVGRNKTVAELSR